jgi:hypothetical protein
VEFRVLSVVVPSFALLAACAVQPKAPPVEAAATEAATLQQIKDNARVVDIAAESASNVDCREVRQTGSYVMRKRCVSRAQAQAEAREAKEWYRTGGREGSVSVVK